MGKNEWEQHWREACKAAWSAADPWAPLAADEDMESSGPQTDPIAAQQLLDCYELLKSGQSTPEVTPELLGLAERCGFVRLPNIQKIGMPADETAQVQWLDQHERVKNTARESHHEEGRVWRHVSWRQILMSNQSITPQTTTNDGLDSMKSQLRNLIQSHLQHSNLGFHSWISGLRHWLLEQRDSGAVLCWRVPDTQITEVGSRQFALDLVATMCTFAAVSIDGCDDAGVEDSHHVWSLDPALSNARLDDLLGMLPSEDKLSGSQRCGEVTLSRSVNLSTRTNIDGNADEVKPSMFSWCTVL